MLVVVFLAVVFHNFARDRNIGVSRNAGAVLLLLSTASCATKETARSEPEILPAPAPDRTDVPVEAEKPRLRLPELKAARRSYHTTPDGRMHGDALPALELEGPEWHETPGALRD